MKHKKSSFFGRFFCKDALHLPAAAGGAEKT
jgi:hypothetical protein